MLRFTVYLSVLFVSTVSQICVDSFGNCPALKAECNQQSVWEACRLTCGLCATTQSSDCHDVFFNCNSYASECSELNIRQNCPVTCGVCVPNSGTPTRPNTVKPTTTTLLPTSSIAPTTTSTTRKATTTTARETTTAPCKDASPNCAVWAKNGFCTNNFYTPEKKKEFCAKTCKLC